MSKLNLYSVWPIVVKMFDGGLRQFVVSAECPPDTYGTGAKLFAHFGTSLTLMVPKCLRSEVSWV